MVVDFLKNNKITLNINRKLFFDEKKIKSNTIERFSGVSIGSKSFRLKFGVHFAYYFSNAI
jgi:hypothetical protein